MNACRSLGRSFCILHFNLFTCLSPCFGGGLPNVSSLARWQLSKCSAPLLHAHSSPEKSIGGPSRWCQQLFSRILKSFISFSCSFSSVSAAADASSAQWAERVREWEREFLWERILCLHWQRASSFSCCGNTAPGCCRTHVSTCPTRVSRRAQLCLRIRESVCVCVCESKCACVRVLSAKCQRVLWHFFATL